MSEERERSTSGETACNKGVQPDGNRACCTLMSRPPECPKMCVPSLTFDL